MNNEPLNLYSVTVPGRSNTEYRHIANACSLAVMLLMNLKNYQITICNALLRENILNQRVEQKVFENHKLNSIKSYYNGLLKRKTRILELIKAAKKAEIELDIEHYLSNIDIVSVKSILKEFELKLPFNKRKNMFIIKLAQTEVSQMTILSLAKSTTEQEFSRIVESIPPAFLLKHGLLKTKDHNISTKNSLRSINTPMRD